MWHTIGFKYFWKESRNVKISLNQAIEVAGYKVSDLELIKLTISNILQTNWLLFNSLTIFCVHWLILLKEIIYIGRPGLGLSICSRLIWFYQLTLKVIWASTSWIHQIRSLSCIWDHTLCQSHFYLGLLLIWNLRNILRGSNLSCWI